jgi:hypothetical protein
MPGTHALLPGDQQGDRGGSVFGGRIHATYLGKERQEAAATTQQEVIRVPDKRPSVKNEKQYEALKDKGMSKERAAKIANSPGASSRGGKKSGSGVRRRATSQGGTTAQKKAAGRKGGKATARKRSA